MLKERILAPLWFLLGILELLPRWNSIPCYKNGEVRNTRVVRSFLGLFSLPSVPFFSEGLISYLVFSNRLWNSLCGFQLTPPRGFLEWFFRSTKMWCFVLINILLLKSVIWKLLSMCLTGPSSTSHTLSSCTVFYSDHSGLSCSCKNIIYWVMYQGFCTVLYIWLAPHFLSISLENHQ